MKFKPALYFAHCWRGMAMCLLFASGIVMMHVEYPELTEDERLLLPELVAFVLDA